MADEQRKPRITSQFWVGIVVAGVPYIAGSIWWFYNQAKASGAETAAVEQDRDAVRRLQGRQVELEAQYQAMNARLIRIESSVTWIERAIRTEKSLNGG